MIVLYILLAAAGLLALLLSVAALRAALIRPARPIAAPPTADPARGQAYARRLSSLLAVETITDRTGRSSAKFYAFHDALARLFPHLHASCEKTDLDGSLLFRWAGSGQRPPIVLMSHMDVVEADGQWTHPPFSGTVADGRVWGRGALDTKGNLFCILQAVEELLEAGFTPPGDVYIASSCTEEHGGRGAPDTVAHLQARGVKPALLLDEGGAILDGPVDGVRGHFALVGVLEKGSGDTRFIARDAGGHASTPPRNTPLVRLGRFMAEVERKNPFHAKFTAPVRRMFAAYLPGMHFPMRLVFANLWLFAPLLARVMIRISPTAAAMLQTTIAFTMASGSQGANVLPQEATVTANMRFIPHEDDTASNARIAALAGKYDITAEILSKNPPSPTTDCQGAAFRAVQSAVQRVFPHVTTAPYIMTAATDARFYAPICDNCLRFAPLVVDKQQLAAVHTTDENISIDALPGGVDFFREIIANAQL